MSATELRTAAVTIQAMSDRHPNTTALTTQPDGFIVRALELGPDDDFDEDAENDLPRWKEAPQGAPIEVDRPLRKHG